MLLKNAKIRNFRSLQRFETPLQRFTVIIGENDVGKTSVLYALNAFFANKKMAEESDYFDWKTDEPIVIEVTVHGLNNDLVIGKFESVDSEVTVRRVFPFGAEPETYIIGSDGAERKLSKTDSNRLFPPETFHFVPVTRSIGEQFSMKKTALLGKTFRALMKRKLGEPDHSKTQEEICNVLKSSIDPARESLQQLLQEQLNDSSISLSFQNLALDPVEGVSFDMMIGDDKMSEVPISQRGAGTQNCMILALYRFVATGISDDFVLALEEPENSFHPKGQRELLIALRRLSEKAQVICTTHSPVFIDRVDFRSNVIIVRLPNGSAIAKTCDPQRFSEAREVLGIRPSDALLKGGGNCGIIAEGIAEESAFPEFMRLCGFNDRELGVSVLPVGGNDVQKILAYVKLLNSYDLPCCVVLDGDVSVGPELERVLKNGTYPMFKFLHILQKGALEDYYPAELIAEFLTFSSEGKVNIGPAQLFPEEKGKRKLELISRLLFDSGFPMNAERLKDELADYVPSRMIEIDSTPDPEFVGVFKIVARIARGEE